MTGPPERPRRAAIGLGDLVRALHDLGLGERGRARHAAIAARCLGFGGEDPNPPEGVRYAGDATRARRPPRPARAPPPARAGIPPPAVSPPSAPGEPRAARLVPLEPAAADDPPPAWLPAPDAAPEPAQAPEPAAASTPPPRAPLLGPLTARAIAAAATATRREGETPDLSRLMRRLARKGVVDRVPRRPRPTVERGAQLVVDLGPGMAPFLDDLRDLGAALEETLGPEQVAHFQHDGNPERAWRWLASGDRAPWRPEPGRPVVLATEFGAAAPAGALEPGTAAGWDRFLARARRAGCPVIAFVPLGPARWPRRLARRVTLVHWSRHTRASSVRQLVGPGHEIGR